MVTIYYITETRRQNAVILISGIVIYLCLNQF